MIQETDECVLCKPWSKLIDSCINKPSHRKEMFNLNDSTEACITKTNYLG